MSLPKVSAATVLLSSLWFAAALPAQTDATPATSANASKVRIVRLSEVKGDVLMDRAIGRGMESATANLPVVEGSRLQTGMGTAEVELEDNSTMRLGPNAAVEFPKLERMPGGSTVSWVRLMKGTAYVSLLKSSPGNEFTLLFGEQRVTLPPSSHIRLAMAEDSAKLAVLEGTLQVQGPSGMEEVRKKRTVTFNLATAGELAVANGVSGEPLDEWDKDSASYHSRLAMVSSANNTPYAYGMSDLSYYGSFMDAGGCGMMWRPYFTSAAWDPYANGSWAWYGNAGYSWVSPYPWGWTPYHYGNWSFCPGMGWGWQPGGSWMGLNNMAMLPVQSGSGGGGSVGHPIRPVHPPGRTEPTIIPVNQRPLVKSEVASPESFVFRKDSAGLGVPRQTLGSLNKFSEHAMTHGQATTNIYISAPGGNAGPGARGSNGAGPVGATIHRGAPPTMGESEPGFGAAGAGAGASNRSGMTGSGRTPAPTQSSGAHPSAGPSSRPR